MERRLFGPGAIFNAKQAGMKSMIVAMSMVGLRILHSGRYIILALGFEHAGVDRVSVSYNSNRALTLEILMGKNSQSYVGKITGATDPSFYP